MLDAELIRLLCCPETRQAVVLADPAIVEKLNAKITARRLKNRAGRVLTEPMDTGLIREDGGVCYPVVHGLPVMLVEEAITLADSD